MKRVLGVEMMTVLGTLGNREINIAQKNIAQKNLKRKMLLARAADRTRDLSQICLGLSLSENHTTRPPGPL